MSSQPEDPTPTEDATEVGHAPDQERKQSIKDWGKSLMVTLIAVLLIKAFVVEAYVVRGASMEPTLADGERLLLEKVSKRFGTFERGDIVVFRFPKDPKKLFIKRIIAIPGDTIRIKGKRVWLNGEEIEEEYVPEGFRTFDDPLEMVMSEHEYFVMGDHRSDSLDSRRRWTVEESQIIGKALVCFWPPKRIHPL